MLVLLIKKENVKDFMHKLLKTDIFNKLELRSIIIKSDINFEITGELNKQEDEQKVRHFISWGEIKSLVLNIISSREKPKYFKIILSLNKKEVENLNSNGKAMFLNLIYENNEILVITGTSQKNFSLDKSLENKWEDIIKKFFKKNNINTETIK